MFVFHNESALRRKGTGERDRKGERNQTRVLFKVKFQLQPNPARSSGVHMALRVCSHTRQVCSTFKLPHQLVLDCRPPQKHRQIPHAPILALAGRCCGQQSLSSSTRQASKESHRRELLDAKHIKAQTLALKIDTRGTHAKNQEWLLHVLLWVHSAR